MSFPLSPTDFPELFPSPDSPREMAEGISELSRFRIARAFTHVVTVTAAYTIDAERDRIVLADATGGAFAVTLPAAANSDAAFYGVKAIDVSGGAVTVVTAPSGGSSDDVPSARQCGSSVRDRGVGHRVGASPSLQYSLGLCAQVLDIRPQSFQRLVSLVVRAYGLGFGVL
jgi:hypothetical protein